MLLTLLVIPILCSLFPAINSNLKEVIYYPSLFQSLTHSVCLWCSCNIKPCTLFPDQDGFNNSVSPYLVVLAGRTGMFDTVFLIHVMQLTKLLVWGYLETSKKAVEAWCSIWSNIFHLCKLLGSSFSSIKHHESHLKIACKLQEWNLSPSEHWASPFEEKRM